MTNPATWAAFIALCQAGKFDEARALVWDDMDEDERVLYFGNGMPMPAKVARVEAKEWTP